jgi:hypothetical protein
MARLDDAVGLKDRGATAFTQRDYACAVQLWLAAVDATAGDADGQEPLRIACLSNVALAELKRGRPLGASSVVRAREPLHAKALFRAAEACLQLRSSDARLLTELSDALALASTQPTASPTDAADLGRQRDAVRGLLEHAVLEKTRLRPPVEPAYLLHNACGGSVFGHSADGVDENLLVLLHGFGDGCEGFARLARSMALPQTAWLSLAGPLALQRTPLRLPGAAWYCP